MKKNTFKWLWDQLVMSIKDVEQSISPEVKKHFHFQCRYNDKQAEKIIRTEYERIKKHLRTQLYKSDNSSKLIDQHKIAACFCNAFLNKKFFSFDMTDEIPVELLLCNYQLAYAVSLRIIYIFLVERYISSEKPEMRELANKLLNQKTLAVPKTAGSHDPYNFGRIKTLALNEYYDVQFDVLGYSNSMFWIEYYNRQLLENCIEIFDSDNPHLSCLS